MRYFIYLAYDGARYHGWQIQPNGISVQEVLQKSLSILLRDDIEVVGAGRTDAGVNATCMVAHFNTDILFSKKDIVRKLNRFLPQDITVSHIRPVKDGAHARFDALSRTYKYYVLISKSAFYRHYTYRIPYPLDFNAMNEAASHLLNYTDFTSFSKLHTDTKTNNCKVLKAEWRMIHHPLIMDNDKDGCLWEFTIQADRFLRNMVRAVVGTLIDVGRGNLSVTDFCHVIEKKDRCSAGTSVPGNALFLSQIEYPEDLFIETVD